MKTRHLDYTTKAPARTVPAMGFGVFLFLAIYNFKGLAAGILFSRAVVFFLLGGGREDQGKGRVGIDGWYGNHWIGCAKVFGTCFPGNGVYGFSAADILV